MEIIQNHLWKYRKEMGYSQKDAAYLLGQSDQSQVCNWEKGIKIPSLKNAIKLSILYRKPVAYLFPRYYQVTRDELRAKEEKWREETGYYKKSQHLQ